MELRDYQKIGVDEIRECYRQKKRAVLYSLFMGGGKTFIFSYIGKRAAAVENRVLVLQHKRELIYQASMTSAALSEKHWVIANKKTISRIKVDQVRKFGRCFIEYGSKICIGSVQTVVNRLDQIQAPSLIIADEAHRSLTGTWRRVIDYFPKARLLGVTGTPTRTNGDGLGVKFGGLYDVMIEGPLPSELIKLGYIVPSEIKFPYGEKFNDSNIKLDAKGDYNTKQLNAEMLRQRPTLIGDAVKHYRQFANNTKFIAFCHNVAASQKMAEKFIESGYNVKSLDGTLDEYERDNIINDLREGNIQGITSCEIVSEGFDCPDVHTIIGARPTKSLIMYLQQNTRNLRSAPGKTHGIFLDMVGNFFEHGAPHWDREWTLAGKRHCKRKINDERALKLVNCPECMCVHEREPECPNCGYVYPIKGRQVKNEDGELITLTPEMEEEYKKKMKYKLKKDRAKAQNIDELLALEKKMGYNNGWAYSVFHARGKKRRKK